MNKIQTRINELDKTKKKQDRLVLALTHPLSIIGLISGNILGVLNESSNPNLMIPHGIIEGFAFYITFAFIVYMITPQNNSELKQELESEA